MPDWKYGDLMRYPKDQDPDDPPNWVFMFVGERHSYGYDYLNVMVVRTHEEDDLWRSGDLLVAGINEMVPLSE